MASWRHKAGAAGPELEVGMFADGPDSGRAGVLAYLVDRLAQEPTTENAGVVAGLLAVQVAPRT